MAENEEWRDIPGFEGYYQASSAGRIRSLDRVQEMDGRWGRFKRKKHGRIVRPHAGRHGYMLTALCRDSEKTKTSVHRVVCETFHGPCPSDAHQVAHIDGVRENNAPHNLRWVTQSENERDKVKHGTYHHGGQKLTAADVRTIKAHPDDCENALAERFGVSDATIRDIRAQRTWRWVR